MKYMYSIIYSNVLIAPCSTADPGIAGAVLIQNKIRNKSNTMLAIW